MPLYVYLYFSTSISSFTYAPTHTTSHLNYRALETLHNLFQIFLKHRCINKEIMRVSVYIKVKNTFFPELELEFLATLNCLKQSSHLPLYFSVLRGFTLIA